MANTVKLNNVDHKDLRVITERGTKFGDAVNGAVIFPAEFSALHKEYPIYFQKSAETGEFEIVALFGFDKDENLFVNDGKWLARTIPAVMQREPFSIGFQESEMMPENRTMVIMVDMDSPRVSNSSEGEAVFKGGGGNSDYLNSVNSALSLIHDGFTSSKAMFAAFESEGLIEQFTLDIKFADESEYKTDMFYSLNKEKFEALPDAVVLEWNRSGLLQVAYMVLESMVNIRYLIDQRNLNLIK